MRASGDLYLQSRGQYLSRLGHFRTQTYNFDGGFGVGVGVVCNFEHSHVTTMTINNMGTRCASTRKIQFYLNISDNL